MRLLKLNWLLLIFFICFSFSLKAQESIIVSWKTNAEKISDGNYKVKISGTIKKGWHIYAVPDEALELSGLNVTADDSSVNISKPELVSKPVAVLDKVFMKTLPLISDSIVFYETLQTADKSAALAININYEVADAESFFPESQNVKIATGEKGTVAVNRILIPSVDIDHPLTDAKTSSSGAAQQTASNNLLTVFFIGFLGGLASLLLPCLFPMIPLTVSFFTNKAGSRRRGIFNAFLYGFFIFLIYVGITIPFHIFEKLNPAIFNNISTNVYLNVAFFAIFIFFALSFFGLYEITLPSAISNKADNKASHQSIWGIFFMALTLTIVSFSCTGPVAGSLLASVAGGEGGAMRLSFGMAGFGVAIGLPFALFALFPNMLNSLPKSGGWLNTVKVFFGFLELGFAFKFLSNADLVSHWGLLKREIFIGIWLVLMVMLSLYLWNVYKFKHDSPVKKLPVFRIVMAVIFSLFSLYLISGVTNTKAANLSLISGFPPPLYYSIYAGKTDCVLDLNCSHDYEEGLKMAREQHKPILLDFTGYACVNCRRMEENVWSRPEVYAVMKNKFIVISLYVDDKKLLPSAQRFTYKTKDGTERDIRTVGDKWSVFETENFKNNAQPLYAIINKDEQLLAYPAAYTPSPKDYLQWLNAGLNAFEKK